MLKHKEEFLRHSKTCSETYVSERVILKCDLELTSLSQNTVIKQTEHSTFAMNYRLFSFVYSGTCLFTLTGSSGCSAIERAVETFAVRAGRLRQRSFLFYCRFSADHCK